ncbi:hypothetical protein PISL3812_00099 [Talaromyces islandicus]|uniref:Uncharacterized protein n=1 Tax=Talaromyces islandicus TaxID=28573 RepID=A0A0U1LIB1_TALIS|nr:hypothetical protein PISL3812_00099 [Talaromyces islandicus]
MKLTTSLISAVALNAAATVARGTASGCNVEGNLFQLEASGKIIRNDTLLNQVTLTPWGELGTDSLAVLDSYGSPTEQKTAVFYINKDNNRLIVLDPFNYMSAANAYTETPEGGELKFTFYNDTSRTFYWPSFDINEQGHLTANGKADIFTHCGSNSTDLLEGTLAIGHVAGKNCKALDYVDIYPVTSQLSVE